MNSLGVGKDGFGLAAILTFISGCRQNMKHKLTKKIWFA